MKKIDISTPKHPNTFVLVDDEDFDWLNQWKWRPENFKNYTNYASRNKYIGGGRKNQKQKRISMHRLITGAPNGVEVDHIDGNGLNNQRENLRLCTRAENSRNLRSNAGVTSKYKGVDKKKHRNKEWRARIRYEGKQVNIGYFKNEIEAAKAYDKKAKELHGEFACLNFAEDQNGKIII